MISPSKATVSLSFFAQSTMTYSAQKLYTSCAIFNLHLEPIAKAYLVNSAYHFL